MNRIELEQKVVEIFNELKNKDQHKISTNDISHYIFSIKKLGPQSKYMMLRYLNDYNTIIRIVSIYIFIEFADKKDQTMIYSIYQNSPTIIKRILRFQHPKYKLNRYVNAIIYDLYSEILKTLDDFDHWDIMNIYRDIINKGAIKLTKTRALILLANINTLNSIKVYDEYRSKVLKRTNLILEFEDVLPGSYIPYEYTRREKFGGAKKIPDIPRPPFLSLGSFLSAPMAYYKLNSNEIWVAFSYPTLGGYYDIWITKLLKNNQWTRPVFTGVTSYCSFMRGYGTRKEKKDLRREKHEISIKVKNDIMEIAGEFFKDCKYKKEKGYDEYGSCKEYKEKYTVNIPELYIDKDDDGLTDLLELRLGTDPSRKDTDNDGIIDARDKDPLTPTQLVPEDDESKIILESFFIEYHDDSSKDLKIIKTPFLKNKISFDIGNNFILNNPSKELIEKMRGELGHNGLAVVGFYYYNYRIDWSVYKKNQFPITYLNKEKTEAMIGIGSSHGGLWAHGYYVKLRKIRNKWYVIEYRMHWKS